jgi:hypothetical protein
MFMLGCHTTKKPYEQLLTTTGNPADLGTILQFASKTHVFKLINTGNESILVTKIVNGCGCTRSKLDNNPIVPGKSTDVTVDLSSDGREGHFASTVTVFWKTLSSNQVNKIDLVVQAVAVSVAVLEPTSVEFSFFEPGDKAKTVLLKIKHGSAGVPWDSVVAWDNSGGLPVKTIDNKTFEIPITFDPEKKPLGTYRDMVKIKLEDHGKEIAQGYQLPVTATLMSDVEATPGSIYLGIMNSGSSKHGTFKIVSKSGYLVNFLSFQFADKSGFHLKLESLKSAKTGSGQAETNISYEVQSPQFSGDASFKVFVKVRSQNTIYDLMIPVIVYSGNI